MQPFLSKAERYCAIAERCPQQVREHLKQWGADEAMTNPIIEYLTEKNYLNEERFCLAFVHDKVSYQGWGRRKIYAALQAYHLDKSAISHAINHIDEDEYTRQLTRLYKQKKGQPYEKVVRFLMQRGFEYSEINNLLRSASEA